MRSCSQEQRRSVDRGTCGPGIEPRKILPSGRRRCRRKRKAPSRAPISRGALESRAVRDPVHVRRHLAREPGDPKSAQDRSCLGTPQGGSASPLLANVYLHYVFDLWVQTWRQKCAHGDVIVVRFADDIVIGFRDKADADQFRAELTERMRKFNLELHPEKTRLLEFGPYAIDQRQWRGEGKPETFNFLGFTHICVKKRSNGM